MEAYLKRPARDRLIRENELPQLPSDWEVERFRFVFQETKERNGSEPVGVMLSVSEYRGVVPREYESAEQQRTDEELTTYRVVRPGQLAVNTMWLNHLGLGVSEHLGHVSPAYAVYSISERLDKRFAHHLLRSRYYLNIYMRYLYGIRPNSYQIKSDDWLSIPVILPPLATQKVIADFLDRETARIDLLIEKKRRLVEVLAEARFSAISRLVTEGVGAQREMEKTTSPYIPTVPKGWRVWRLKQLARVRGGLTLGRNTKPEDQLFRTPYLRVANVQAGWVDLSDVAEIDATAPEISRYSLRAGDVLMNEGGDNDKLGRGAVWGAQIDPCLNQNHVFCVRPHDMRHSEWISLATNARYARDFFYLHSNQSTNLASISKTNLERFPIAMPQLREMQLILEVLGRTLAAYSDLAKLEGQSIDRLREFRAALITAAVTGQIDPETWSRRGATDRRLDQIAAEMGA